MKATFHFVLFVLAVMKVMALEPIPQELNALAKQGMTSAGFFMASDRDWEHRRKQFLEVMVQIGQRCDKKLEALCRQGEGSSMECKLICIAVDFRDHRDRFEEIAANCLHLPVSEIDNVELPSYPPPKNTYCTEEWRLAWEYFLLVPDRALFNGRPYADFHARVVLPALRTIKSSNSNILYEYCFRAAADAYLDRSNSRPLYEPWQDLIAALSDTVSVDSAQSMFKCLDYVKYQTIPYSDTREAVVSLLLGVPIYETVMHGRGSLRDREELPTWRARRSAWAAILAKIPSDFTPDSASVLKEILESPIP